MREAAEDLTQATLALFDGGQMKISTTGFLTQDLEVINSQLQQGEFEILMGDIVGYRGQVQGLRISPHDADIAGTTSLDFASLDFRNTWPENYGQSVARLYGDMVDQLYFGIEQPDPSWADILAIYNFDLNSLASDFVVQGLEVETVPGQASLALENASLSMPWELTADPFRVEQAISLNWTGLGAKAQDAQVQTYFDAWLPKQATLEALGFMALSPEAMAALADIPLSEDINQGLSQFDFQIDLSELELIADLIQIMGSGTANPSFAEPIQDSLGDTINGPIDLNLVADFSMIGIPPCSR